LWNTSTPPAALTRPPRPAPPRPARARRLPQPNHVVGIREKRWKLSRVFDPARAVTGNVGAYEFYDLKYDPRELKNLAWPGFERSAEQQAQFSRMVKKLANASAKRLRPLSIGTAFPFTVDGRLVNVNPGVVFLTDAGNVTGLPTAFANVVTNTTMLPDSKARNEFVMWNGAGLITGTSELTVFENATTVVLDGVATITGGTGAFRGIRAQGIVYTDVARKGTEGSPVTTIKTTYRGEFTISGVVAVTGEEEAAARRL
jgi:hypothetical protein